MEVLRLANNVPEIYTKESRDFQLLTRGYDCLINVFKYSIEDMLSATDTDQCNNRLLELLATKLGFFTNASFTDDELRGILSVFPVLMKNKGSIKAIIASVYLFIKLKQMQTDVLVTVDKLLWKWSDSFSKTDTTGAAHTLTNSGETPYSVGITGSRGDLVVNIVDNLGWTWNIDYENSYTIKVGISSSVQNKQILEELFKYIVPTGYKVLFYFYSAPQVTGTRMVSHDVGKVILISDSVAAKIRNSSYTGVADLVIGAVDTVEIIAPENVLDQDIETEYSLS